MKRATRKYKRTVAHNDQLIAHNDQLISHNDKQIAQEERVDANESAKLGAIGIEGALGVIAYRLKIGDERFALMEKKLTDSAKDNNTKLSELAVQLGNITTRVEDFIAACAVCTANIKVLSNESEQRKGTKNLGKVIWAIGGSVITAWVLKLIGVLKFKF